MQNVPRIYISEVLEEQKQIPVNKEVAHYLRHVMRRTDCLVFNGGDEYTATLSDDNRYLVTGNKTNHMDTSNDLILYFAPIKKTEELVNMATQMGVGTLQPVITARTVAHHINWGRMKKIIVEASEQSNRNSVPVLMEPIKFADLDLHNLIVADERFAHGKDGAGQVANSKRIFVGPEGGFSPQEFEKMDAEHVCGISLGKTVLRAETAAVVALAKVLNK